MKDIDTILDELEQFVQEMRESGDVDLRIVLWAIRNFKRDKNYPLIEKDETKQR